MRFEIVKSTKEIPSDWDMLTEFYFQKIEFLRHIEIYNPCNQRYYLCYQDNILLAAATVYTIRLNLLTFLKIKSPIKMHIIGVPCSVSSQGIIGDSDGIIALKSYIFQREKGFVLALNLQVNTENCNHASGTTLPTIVMQNRFESWEIYLSALRSDYRRRLNHITHAETGLQIKTMKCSEFSDEMYKQYLQVFQRSKAKLEKLSYDFFKYLPESFKLNVCLLNSNVLGWNITICEGDIHYFFLGGIDYHYNNDNSTYLRLLANIVKEGIENKAAYIELGQTAEIPKMRMGGERIDLKMEARHSNLIFNRILYYGKKLLEYNIDLPRFNVFRR
ncbi:MAG: GNAT family N-acetyltransferase [Bacteroidota bacterium]